MPKEMKWCGTQCQIPHGSQNTKTPGVRANQQQGKKTMKLVYLQAHKLAAQITHSRAGVLQLCLREGLSSDEPNWCPTRSSTVY